MKIIDSILMWVFVRCGAYFFNTISVYSPDDENIEVLHFGISEQAISKSCHEISENSIK